MMLHLNYEKYTSSVNLYSWGEIDNLVSRCVDLRTGAFDVPPQEILTKDSVTVTVDAVVYYQVKGSMPVSIYNVLSYSTF